MDSHEDVRQLTSGARPHRIFSLDEFLGMIAEHLEGDNQALRSFISVNRAFHSAGVPVLYGKLCFQLPREWHMISKSVMDLHHHMLSITPSSENSHLCLTRHFRHALEYCSVPDLLDLSFIFPMHETLQGLLDELTGLTSYECINMPPSAEQINHLIRSCPRLSRVNIVFPKAYIYPQVQYGTSWQQNFSPQHLDTFSGLKKLCLSNMSVNLKSWHQLIVKSLQASPGLEHLSLSLDIPASNWSPPVEGEDVLGCFTNICRDYSATGALPLRLKTIELGQGFWLVDSGAFLSLVEPCCLEEVELETHFGRKYGVYASGNRPHLDLSVFSETSCPKLNRLAFDTATPDISRWLLNQSPDFTKKLAVHFRQGWDEDKAQQQHPWPSPHSDHIQWGWYDDDTLGLMMMTTHKPSVPPFRGLQLGGHLSMLQRQGAVDMAGLDRLADTIVSVHGHCLEELSLGHLAKELSHSKRLALESFHCSLISRLPKLQDLVILPIQARRLPLQSLQNCGSKSPRHDGYTDQQKERLAHMLALAAGFGSRLRRIMLTRHVAVELVRSPGEHGFRFREMTQCELESVPLFRFFQDCPEN